MIQSPVLFVAFKSRISKNNFLEGDYVTKESEFDRTRICVFNIVWLLSGFNSNMDYIKYTPSVSKGRVVASF